MEALQQQVSALLESQRVMQEQIVAQNTTIQTLREEQAQAAPSSQLMTSLEQLTKAMRGADNKNLVDTRGFGRPLPFNNKEEDFRVWSRKIANYIRGVYKEANQLLELSLQTDKEVDLDAIELLAENVD